MVLDRDRQALQRPGVARLRQPAIGFFGFFERALLDQSDDRIDLVIEGLDSLEESGHDSVEETSRARNRLTRRLAGAKQSSSTIGIG